MYRYIYKNDFYDGRGSAFTIQSYDGGGAQVIIFIDYFYIWVICF